MTRQFEREWLRDHAQYRIKLAGEPDNPDQRISEDLWQLADMTLFLFKNFIQTMARLISFVGLLWVMSGVQTVQIAGATFTVCGYLVWIALIFSAASTAFMHWVGHPLRELNVERQHREADYRATLLRVRESAADDLFLISILHFDFPFLKINHIYYF